MNAPIHFPTERPHCSLVGHDLADHIGARCAHCGLEVLPPPRLVIVKRKVLWWPTILSWLTSAAILATVFFSSR